MFGYVEVTRPALQYVMHDDTHLERLAYVYIIAHFVSF
jgi:hypothetical protein